MVKQVIVMRKDLGMGSGKMIAQGAHASLGVILDLMKDVDFGAGLYQDQLTYSYGSPLYEWLHGSFTKICLGVDSEEELMVLMDNACSKDLPVKLITDSGRTVFDGVPTNTCIAIGPASSEDIDKITGHLKLL